MATVVNKPSSRNQRAASDLRGLNDAERRVLRLLAEGHTAKSISNLIGSTPAAVNERLREARRKTRVGSSRELARLLRAQESRDEEFGIVVDGRSVASAASSDARFGRFQAGAMAMFGLGLVAAAGAIALLSQTSHSNEVEPILGTALPSSDPAVWHAQLRAQSRDPQWAAGAERTIHARFARVPHVGGPHSILRVTCATSICEVAGTIDVPESRQDNDSLNNPLNRTMRELQGKALHDDLLKAGLDQKDALFTSTRSKPERMAFFIYFSRVAG